MEILTTFRSSVLYGQDTVKHDASTLLRKFIAGMKPGLDESDSMNDLDIVPQVEIDNGGNIYVNTLNVAYFKVDDDYNPYIVTPCQNLSWFVLEEI